MKIPVIQLCDNCTGHQFTVTDCDPHDYLYADEKGIHYYNLQNGEGTGECSEGGYSFVGKEGYMGTDIPMLDIMDILLLYHDIKIKPLGNEVLNFEFDMVLEKFKALDMLVEHGIEEREERLRKIMMKQVIQEGGNHEI